RIAWKQTRQYTIIVVHGIGLPMKKATTLANIEPYLITAQRLQTVCQIDLKNGLRFQAKLAVAK
ncbi:unnamed protein product, partial [marine sediment metagenome]